jgi:histidinol-phosphate aminotransferase
MINMDMPFSEQQMPVPALISAAAFRGIRLDANERGWDMPEEIKKILTKEIMQTPLQTYPNDAQLREDLGKFWQVDPRQVVLGNGSDELIQIICLALARDQSLIFPVPTFSMYQQCAEIIGIRPVPVPLHKDFSLDGRGIVAAARRYPGPIVICQPNNPTGQRFAEQTLRLILDNAPEAVILDEAYGEFTGQNYRSWLEEYPQLILIRTFSKAMGLAGMRVGYSLSGLEMAERLNRVRPPYNVSTLSLMAARLALRYPAYWQKTLPAMMRERERLAAYLEKKLHCRVYPSETNFLLFIPPVPAAALWAACREKGVLLRNLSNVPGLENHLRISIGNRTENELAMEVLERSMTGKSFYGGCSL